MEMVETTVQAMRNNKFRIFQHFGTMGWLTAALLQLQIASLFKNPQLEHGCPIRATYW